MKEWMTGMILYNNRNAYFFGNHVGTAHKRIFSLFSYIDGWPKIMAGDDAYSLEGSVETPLARRKMSNYESSCTSAMLGFF